MIRRMISGVVALAAIALMSSCDKKTTGPDPEVPSRTYNVKVLNPSSRALAGASVLLQTPSQNYLATTDGNGVATLRIPNTVTLPTWVVMVATHASIMPEALACPGAANAIASPVISTLAMPSNLIVRDVFLHHLGNDQYGGAANSQLQLASEGITRSYAFNLSSVPSAMPMIRLFARGVEHPTEVYINGTRVNMLGDSPTNGSLASYGFRLGGSARNLLRSGSNTLAIKTAAFEPSDPWDDIEFCGLVLYYP